MNSTTSATGSVPPPLTPSASGPRRENFIQTTVDRLYSYLIDTLNTFHFEEESARITAFKRLRPTIVQILLYLDPIQLPSTLTKTYLLKIESIYNHVLQLKTTFDNVIHFSKSLPIKPRIGLKICFFLTTAASKDYNGAITSGLIYCIEQQVPFVALKSMLRCTGIERDHVWQDMEKLENTFFRHQEYWTFFEQTDSQSDKEIILCLPKLVLKSPIDQKSLEALDFAANNSLTQITLDKVLEGSENEFRLSSLFELFTKTPKLHKIFYVFGHGDLFYIAGINNSQILNLINFAKKQLCEAFCISSCELGGVASTTLIQNEPSPHPFCPLPKEEKALPFPIIIRSIGGFPTFCKQKAEKKIGLFLERLRIYLSSPKVQTLQNFRRMIEKLEENKEKSFNNNIQVYFPHSRGVPGGFRPIDEGSQGCSVTYRKVKTAEIENTPFFQMTGVPYIEIFPLVVSIPLQFKLYNSTLLSMIPGNAHHYLKQIQIDPFLLETPSEYLAFLVDSYLKMKPQKITKSFFIEEITSGHQTIKHAVLSISPSQVLYLWKENKKWYFSTNGYNKKEISSLIYELICFQILIKTLSNPKSLRASTAGLEDESFFFKAIYQSNFFSNPLFKILFNNKNLDLDTTSLLAQFSKSNAFSHKDLKKVFLFKSTFQDTLKQSTFLIYGLFQKLTHTKCTAATYELTFLNHVQKYHISSSEIVEIIFFLLSHNYASLAVSLYQLYSVDSNAKSMCGEPLLCTAIKANAFELCQLLIKDPYLDINLCTKEKQTALFLCIEEKFILENEMKSLSKTPLEAISPDQLEKKEAILKYADAELSKLTELILNHPELNFDHKDQNGWKVFDYALENFKLCKWLLQIKSKTATTSTYIDYMLSNSIGLRLYSHIPKLIKLKANPNKGNPSALVLSVREDESIVQQLLLAGGNPMIPDGGGKIPLIEALLRGYTHTVALFLKYWKTKENASFPYCLQNIADSFKLTPLIAGLLSGSKKKLKILKKFKTPLYIPLTDDNESKLDFIFKRWIETKSYHLFAYILKWGSKETSLKKYLARYLLQNGHHELARELMECNLFNLRKNLVFTEIITTQKIDLVKLAVQKNAPLNLHVLDKWKMSPLEVAAKYLDSPQGETIFKYLIEAGADPLASTVYFPSAFSRVVETGNLKLVKYCTEERNIEWQNQNLPILSLAAKLKNNPSGEIFKYLYFQSNLDLNAYEPNFPSSIFSILLEHGSLEIVQWALNEGAEINPSSFKMRKSPLQLAAARQDNQGREIFKMLLTKGADINLSGTLKELPILTILLKGDFRLAQLGFIYGAKLSKLEQSFALVNAAYSGNPKLLKFLLNKKFQFSDMPVSNLEVCYKGYSKGGIEILKLLLPFSRKLEVSYYEMQDLWHEIINNNDTEAAKLLLAERTHPWNQLKFVNIQELVIDLYNLHFLKFLKEYNGQLALQKISKVSLLKHVSKEKFEIIQFLLEEKLNTKCFTELNGRNILFQAAVRQSEPNIEFIRLLFQCNINPKQHVDNMTSIYYAVFRNHSKLVRLLLNYGAATEIAVKCKITHQNALQLALSGKNPKIINLLQSALSQLKTRD